MLASDKENQNTTENDDVSHLPQQVVFIKPVIKHFVEGNQTVYMVLTDKGRSLAIFDSIKACKHFAIRNRLDLYFAH